MKTSTIIAAAIILSATAVQALAATPKSCSHRFLKWSVPHKAGDLNPRTSKPFKRASNGVCRVNQKAVKEAIKKGLK